MSTEILRKTDLEKWLPHFAPSIRFGVTQLSRPISMDYYDQWLRDQMHADMDYLVRHRDAKENINRWLPFAQSAIVFAIDYVTGSSTEISNADSPLPKSLRTALYTKYAPDMADYHEVIKSRLQPILEKLKELYPGNEFRLAVDAEPILERDLAVRAGLGWVGKNTCVIDRNGGSLFFIAEILTSMKTDDVAVVSPDHCGTCTRCLDICPTNALTETRVLDARLCISYWTIESKTVPPKDLRRNFQDWFFGCDLCQTVCPWNGKVWGRKEMEAATNGPSVPSADLSADQSSDLREKLIFEIQSILEGSNRELTRRYKNTPLARSRGFGLKRNALIVIENRNLFELRPTLELFVTRTETHVDLKELASQVLERLGSQKDSLKL